MVTKNEQRQEELKELIRICKKSKVNSFLTKQKLSENILAVKNEREEVLKIIDKEIGIVVNGYIPIKQKIFNKQNSQIPLQKMSVPEVLYNYLDELKQKLEKK